MEEIVWEYKGLCYKLKLSNFQKILLYFAKFSTNLNIVPLGIAILGAHI